MTSVDELQLTYLPVSRRTFASVEQLDELPRELGWPLEYRQIEPGSFSSTFTVLDGDSWFLMEEQSSRRVEVAAGAPAGTFVLALSEGDTVAVNGRSLDTEDIFLQTPDSDFRAILPADTKATQIGVSDELFEEVLRAVAPELSVPLGNIAVFPMVPGRSASLRWDMRAAILTPSASRATREEAVSSILADMIAALTDHDQALDGRYLHRAGAQRVLDRARAFIEAHLDDAIRVASLCSYSATSLRSLERIFARELGVSPKQYVKARRLNAVRRRLLAADEESVLRITEVAQNYGFVHLGRFAGEYRRYFGESPRETLRSR